MSQCLKISPPVKPRQSTTTAAGVLPESEASGAQALLGDTEAALPREWDPDGEPSLSWDFEGRNCAIALGGEMGKETIQA